MRNKDNLLTDWISTDEAAKIIAEKIASGEYKKGELKKSSCKFANGKDKTDGYMCRVVILKKNPVPASAPLPNIKAKPVARAARMNWEIQISSFGSWGGYKHLLFNPASGKYGVGVSNTVDSPVSIVCKDTSEENALHELHKY